MGLREEKPPEMLTFGPDRQTAGPGLKGVWRHTDQVRRQLYKGLGMTGQAWAQPRYSPWQGLTKCHKGPSASFPGAVPPCQLLCAGHFPFLSLAPSLFLFYCGTCVRGKTT